MNGTWPPTQLTTRWDLRGHACRSTPPVLQLTLSKIPIPRKPFQLPSGSFLYTTSTVPRTCIGAPPGDVTNEPVNGRHSTAQPSQKSQVFGFRNVAQHLEVVLAVWRSLLSRIACLPTSAGGTGPRRTASSVHRSVSATGSRDNVAAMSCWRAFSMAARSAARPLSLPADAAGP